MASNVLVIGGTRYFGIPMVKKLVKRGYRVTIATRGITNDKFGNEVNRIRLDLNREDSVRDALKGKCFDVVIDKMGYSSNEMKWILESVQCGRFVHMSTAGVYTLDHYDIREEEFDGSKGEITWCGRKDMSYDDVKRNAERVLCQNYASLSWASLRVPFVLGRDDYTGRLRFYVEHVINQIPMFIDNLESRFCVAEKNEVSDLLVNLAENTYHGPINGCSEGLLSVYGILTYVQEKTGRKAIIEIDGDIAPYNGTKDNSLSTEKAQKMGFSFKPVHDWIYQLLDYFIEEVKNSNNDGFR